ETKFALVDSNERLVSTHVSLVPYMDQSANIERDRAATAFVRESLSSTQLASERNKFDFATPLLKSKMKIGDYHVFLCHTIKDKPQVKKLGEHLKEYGILPWLDEWELRPGLPWQHLLENQIGQIRSAAVFVGKEGIGPWQQLELQAFLREFVKRGCTVILVLLAHA